MSAKLNLEGLYGIEKPSYNAERVPQERNVARFADYGHARAGRVAADGLPAQPETGALAPAGHIHAAAREIFNAIVISKRSMKRPLGTPGWFNVELFVGTIDFTNDVSDERGRLAVAASRYAAWAAANRPLGPSSVEQAFGHDRPLGPRLLPGDARILRDNPGAPSGDGLRHPADPPSGTGALIPAVEAIFRSIADSSRVAAFNDAPHFSG